MGSLADVQRTLGTTIVKSAYDALLSVLTGSPIPPKTAHVKKITT